MTVSRAPWVGREVADGRFRVTALLGEGGMASVFHAIEAATGRDVVLKVPKPALLADPEFAHRFAREIRTLVELKHPSILTVLGFARHDGWPIAVLEHLSGGTLETRPRPCKSADLAKWLPSVAAALDHIHAAGYVHRDVKPGNILFDAAGHAKLADFGIIKTIDDRAAAQTQALTGSGEAIGTPEYMAPELARGEKYDGRADQYALAVTVYEMLSGRRPFEGGTGAVVLVKQINDEPPPLDEVAAVPERIAAVVSRAMAKTPKMRYPSCTEFARAIAGDRGAARLAVAESDESEGRSLALPLILGGGLLAALAGAVGLWLALGRGTPELERQPEAARIADTPRGATDDRPQFRIELEKPPEPDAAGTQLTIPIRLVRLGNWRGPVRLTTHTDGSVTIRGDTTIAVDATRGQILATVPAEGPVARVTIEAQAGDVRSEVVVELKSPGVGYAIEPIDTVTVGPGAAVPITLFLNRTGNARPVQLEAICPPGLRTDPAKLVIAADKSEAVFGLHATASAKAGEVTIVDSATRAPRAKFTVRVTEVATAPPSTPASGSVIKQVANLESAVTWLEFHPTESGTLFAWDQSSVTGWSVASGQRSLRIPLSGVPTRGCVSPDGRRLVTAFGSRCSIATVRTQSAGTPADLRTAVLGIYFDGPKPYFRARGGVADQSGVTVNASSIPRTVEWVRYASLGSPPPQLRLDDGKLQWLSSNKTATLVAPGKIVAGAISAGGRWIVALTADELFLYDTQAANPAESIWSAREPGGSAVAISPDGKSIVVGVGRGLRLHTPTPER